MEVSRVELVESNRSLGDKEKFPYTLFSLNSSEQNLYDSFRARHDKLKATLDGLKNKELRGGEKKRGEEELKKMFLELVNPYLQKQGLRALGCFTTYGDEARRTFLRMPHYLLFEDNKPFNASIEPQYLFSTEDENLSCDSKLDYQPENYSIYERSVVYNLLEKIIEGQEQDGITLPIISRRGFMYFASTEFTTPLMSFIRNILKSVGPKEMEKLIILNTEYSNQCRRGESSDTKLQQEVFKEAYEKRLQGVISFHDFRGNVLKQKYIF